MQNPDWPGLAGGIMIAPEGRAWRGVDGGPMVGGGVTAVPATRGHLAGGRPRPPAAPQRVALRHAGRPASADDPGPRRPIGHGARTAPWPMRLIARCRAISPPNATCLTKRTTAVLRSEAVGQTPFVLGGFLDRPLQPAPSPLLPPAAPAPTFHSAIPSWGSQAVGLARRLQACMAKHCI